LEIYSGVTMTKIIHCESKPTGPFFIWP